MENKNTCSLIMLDIMMPDLDGFQVLQQVRQTSNVPVLMLTAKSDEEDKVSGLRMGADDYLTKPFSINQLMARVNSLIRRYTLLNPTSSTEMDCMVFQGMTIDNLNRLVFMNDVQVELTGKEFELLSFLAANKGKVFTKKQIYTYVWAEEYAFGDSNIMSFILNNLLQNTLMHSGGNKLTLKLLENEQQAKIVISDNGKGISPLIFHIFLKECINVTVRVLLFAAKRTCTMGNQKTG